jgi:hypothetical protein
MSKVPSLFFAREYALGLPGDVNPKKLEHSGQGTWANSILIVDGPSQQAKAAESGAEAE